MDPDQTESELGLRCLTERLDKYLSRRQKQTTFVMIDALKVNLYHVHVHEHISKLPDTEPKCTGHGFRSCSPWSISFVHLMHV